MADDFIQTDETDPLEHQVVHHVSQRKKRRKGVGGEGMELQLTSMIDVIFQLLIYFVITANFMIDEGTIQATLPGNNNPNPMEQLDKLQRIDIVLQGADDGRVLTVKVKGQTIQGGATGLYAYLQSQVDSGRFQSDQTVEIKPQGTVRWQHVVNVFNACVRAKLENVGFAPPG